MTTGRWVLALAFMAGVVLILSGPGARFGLWDFRFGFQLMRWAVYLAGASAALALILLFFKQQRRTSSAALISALILAGVTAYIPWSQLQKARSLPRIHDISTDVVDVPAFVDIAPLRMDAPNPVAYAGPETAEQQQQAYPDIQTYLSTTNVQTTFEASLGVVQSMGWTLVSANVSEGRIEASDTTFWYGFIDDVVIRIRAEGDQTEVDIRSKSRVGMSDVGKNAERIRAFFAELEQRL